MYTVYVYYYLYPLSNPIIACIVGHCRKSANGSFLQFWGSDVQGEGILEIWPMYDLRLQK